LPALEENWERNALKKGERRPESLEIGESGPLISARGKKKREYDISLMPGAGGWGEKKKTRFERRSKDLERKPVKELARHLEVGAFDTIGDGR